MRNLVIAGIVILVMVLAWHLFIWTKLPSNANINVNPFTDVALVKTVGASQLGFTDPSAIAAFNGARDLIGSTIGERQLSNVVREYFDVYAVILPYHIVVKDQKLPLTATSSTLSAGVRQRPHTGEYTNERFGFRFAYPAGFKSERSPDNGDGIHLTSQDGLAVINAWGSNSSTGFQGYYDSYVKEMGTEPTYSKIGNGWFVLSWSKDGQISYVKMFVGSASLNGFRLDYPEDQADLYKPVMSRLEKTFHPGDLSKSW